MSDTPEDKDHWLARFGFGAARLAFVAGIVLMFYSIFRTLFTDFGHVKKILVFMVSSPYSLGIALMFIVAPLLLGLGVCGLKLKKQS